MAFKFFGKKGVETFKDDKPSSPPKGEQAYSEPSKLYGTTQFEKYDPDSLKKRKGVTIYARMMIDEQVKAAVNFKRGAITSRDYLFDLSDYQKEELGEEAAQQRLDLCYEIIDQMTGSFTDTLNNIMSAMWNGFSMNEINYKNIEFDKRTWIGLDSIKLKPADTFLFDADEYGNIIKVSQKVAGQENKIDIKKFIHFVINPETDEHYGGSELRAAYRAWWSKENVIKFWNIWLERVAGGFTVIKPSDTDGISIMPGTQAYTELQNILQNLSGSPGILLPKGLQLEQIQPGATAAFKEAVDEHNVSIAKALLVPNLLGVTPSGQTGSYSQADVQLDAFFWTLELDTKRLEDALNEQLWRRLSVFNFNDENWPRFKFKPMSRTQMYRLVSVWKELVSAGAVKHSDTDEAHLRELLDFPELGEVDQPVNVIPPNPADNGGTLPDADDDATDDSSQEGKPDSGSLQVEEKNEKGKKGGQTVVGKMGIAITAFTRAEKRVDFTVIDNNSTAIVDEYTKQVGEVGGLIVKDLISKAKEGGGLKQDITDNIKALKVDSKLKSKLNRTVSASLRDSYNLGKRHAQREIDTAKKEAFSRNIGYERFDAIAEDYYKIKSFKVTGDLTDEYIRIIESIILNGARYDKTWIEVEQEIYDTLAKKGMLSYDDAVEALGEALGSVNPSARLNTLIRTNTFDAINNARYTYFTEPELGDFVQAFEYSAILDNRTTEICRHLDEQNAGDHSRKWYDQHPEYRPPNHYNCRSVLIPVTIEDLDEYKEGPQPTLEPQDGFK